MNNFLKNSNILITGGLGFIGTNLIIKLRNCGCKNVFCLDNFSYASSLSYVQDINHYIESKNIFKIDISLREDVQKAIEFSKPNIIFHIAAQTHVDRSIESPYLFIESNIIGTYNLLEEAKIYWRKSNNQIRKNFKFLHISTDEVYGDLKNKETANENTAYDPSSPYSASKASSDHLVKAWNRTYGLPTIITNCSNNYGPWQFPEKLIPLTIIKILSKDKIPLYGDGRNIRNWIFVQDHIDALLSCATNGIVGETYCIGSKIDISNKDLVEIICKLMQKLIPAKFSYLDLIEYVEDRPGHDIRYSINSNKIKKNLNWETKYSLEEGLERTINWYLENSKWLKNIQNKADYNYERIGLIKKDFKRK